MSFHITDYTSKWNNYDIYMYIYVSYISVLWFKTNGLIT